MLVDSPPMRLESRIVGSIQIAILRMLRVVGVGCSIGMDMFSSCAD